MSNYSKLGQFDSEYAAVLAKLPPPPPPEKERVHSRLREQFDVHFVGKTKDTLRPHLPPEDAYTVADRHVQLDDGDILVRCLTPRGSGDISFPVLFWIHGGDRHNQCRVSTVNNQALFGGDISRGFLIGGQSAGSNYGAVLAYRARDDPFFENRRLSGTILQLPIVLHPDAHPEKYKDELLSVDECRDTPLLNGEQMKITWVELGAEPLNPECSPFLNSSHAGLPPTYLQVCGQDPLRDEALVCERLLKEANVATRLDVLQGRFEMASRSRLPTVESARHANKKMLDIYLITAPRWIVLRVCVYATLYVAWLPYDAVFHVVPVDDLTGSSHGEGHNARRPDIHTVIPACSCRTGVAEPYLPSDVVDEGTRIFEEVLRTWASQISERDDDDVVMGDSEGPHNLTAVRPPPTTGIVPPFGVYLVLWLDSFRMVQHFDDPLLHEAARQLSPGKYIAYVATNTDLPMPYRPWHRCLVRLAGLGMPKDQPEQFITSDMCVPIFPATEHPAGRRPSRPTKPFPFASFYLHTWVYATVRFPLQNVDYGDAWEITVEDQEDHGDYMTEDQEKRDTLRKQASPPTATIEPSITDEVTPDIIVGLNVVAKVEDWLKTTDHSQEPFEELHMDNEVDSEVSDGDAPDSLLDDEVSPSTPPSDYDANSLDEVNQLLASVFYPDFSNIDVDVIPMVGFSFDLTEVKQFLDPRGFLEEVEAMAELIRKYRTGALGGGPGSHALPDLPIASHPGDHTIPVDSPTAVAPADPLAVLPSNSMVVFVGHSYATTPSEQVSNPAHSRPPISLELPRAASDVDVASWWWEPQAETQQSSIDAELTIRQQFGSLHNFNGSWACLVRFNTTMSSYRPTRGVVPPFGVYLVLWLDPVRMVQYFDDPCLQAAARQLSSGKYIAYVAVVRLPDICDSGNNIDAAA
ncbi:predicted protein [Postia placenta Mad-698-R]|nr:predicted protein [Postia placenta Mad-698-R]